MTAPKKTSPEAPANGYEQTKQLIEQMKKTGLVTPLMNTLEKLLEDPLLKKTMEELPATNSSTKRSEDLN